VLGRPGPPHIREALCAPCEQFTWRFHLLRVRQVAPFGCCFNPVLAAAGQSLLVFLMPLHRELFSQQGFLLGSTMLLRKTMVWLIAAPSSTRPQPQSLPPGSQGRCTGGAGGVSASKLFVLLNRLLLWCGAVSHSFLPSCTTLHLLSR